ncbi:unnamed protein product [Clonostachys rosea f. rosea IK726]|uniref:Uncharacterized protein n=1 Tax=Clonostachys rosea f. rosea IK726 TaxID=1349383 RepID=A0ACA9U7E8_BIOOC|nr:unnamed protein product [Clonostachys rosea f. rosea IK726]
MVCLKQLSLTAVVALSLSERGLAAPIYAPTNERALEDRAIKNLMAGIRKHGSETIGNTINALKVAAELKSALTPQPQQRGLDNLDERSLKYLEDRGVKTQRLKKAASSVGRHGPTALGHLFAGATAVAEAKNAFFPQPQQPQRRSLEHLEDRGVKTQSLKKGASSVGRHGLTTLKLGIDGLTAAAEVKNAFFPQPQQPQRRSLGHLEDRGVKSQRFKKGASSVGRHGLTVLELGVDGLTAAAEVKKAFFSQPQQPQQPKRRNLEELQQRAFEDYIKELYF